MPELDPDLMNAYASHAASLEPAKKQAAFPLTPEEARKCHDADTDLWVAAGQGLLKRSCTLVNTDFELALELQAAADLLFEAARYRITQNWLHATKAIHITVKEKTK